MSTTNPDATKICMTNLERLNVELNEKEYFSDWQRIYAMILEEHDLNPYEYYESVNDRAAMLECVYDVFQKLSNNIDLFRKVETEFASTTAAYQYLQLRLKDIREEIDRAKHTSGTADSIVSYMFFNRYGG